MKNGEKNNKEPKNQISEEIFGNDLFPEEADEPISDEPTESLNPDEDYESEAAAGAKKSIKKQEDMTNSSPDLTSSDIDASWDQADTSEEVTYGENPTPDQDQVDENSKPWGTNYSADEELNVLNKARQLENKRKKDEE